MAELRAALRELDACVVKYCGRRWEREAPPAAVAPAPAEPRAGWRFLRWLKGAGVTVSVKPKP